MDLFTTHTPAPLTLRALARLLSYPGAELRDHFGDLREALRGERALGGARSAELEALIATLERGDPLEVEAEYVQLFDRGRSTSLHLFEHVHGDSRDRGPAMVDLARTYGQAGLYLAPGELPDFLPVVLEFVSTQPPREARAFLAEMAHLFNAILGALIERGSAYASALAALLELAGGKAEPVKIAADEPLDAAWDEPAAFDGCATRGQAKPGTPQPIHIVRKVDTAAQGVSS